MKAEESFTEGIYTVDLFRDDDCSNPREDDGHFLWLGFPHRSYTIGDEQIDPGDYEFTGLDDLVEQLKVEYEAIHAFPTEMFDHSGVSHYLHNGGLRDRWDCGISGVMLLTKQQAEEWGCATEEKAVRESMAAELTEYTAWCSGDCWGYAVRLSDDYEPTPVDYLEWAKGVAERTTTASLRDFIEAKYEPDDSCWGFIGMEYAEREAKDALHLHAKQGATA